MSNLIIKGDDRLPMYFGDFGGYLVPDSFASNTLLFVADVKKYLDTTEFRQYFEELVSLLPDIELVKKSIDGREVCLVRSQAQEYIVAGYLALAKCRNTVAFASARHERIARFVLAGCERLGLKGDITLSRELSENRTLVDDLTRVGLTVDDTTCARLYNRTHSYAFQKFNADVVGGTWIPYSTTVGPYPFPALGRLFAAEFGKKLAAILDHPDAIVATMQNGESAVAAFAGYENSGATFVTVEEPVCQEFHGDYSGCLLLYMRYARKTEYSIAVSPIIANMWRMAKAIRLGADSYLEAEACDGICSASMRAFKLVSERLPDVASMIIVEGENEQVD